MVNWNVHYHGFHWHNNGNKGMSQAFRRRILNVSLRHIQRSFVEKEAWIDEKRQRIET